MERTNKSIWIDVDNSPHVPLFAPIIRHYRSLGTEVILTARNHSQTIELLNLHGFAGSFTPIGIHYGKGKLGKILGTLRRANQLAKHIKNHRRAGAKISLALSHGSRSLVLAAKWLGIPSITMYDYEFTETQIFNRFSTRILVPEMIPDSVLDEIGLPAGRRKKYPGIKEELYVSAFHPEAGFRQSFFKIVGWEETGREILAVLRPPATSANYHAEKSEVLFDDILRFLTNATKVFTVIMPRTKDQADAIRARISKMGIDTCRWKILETAADGLQLAYASDLLISGGGTMNREAALLGVPVYSIFAGRQGALDRAMEEEGMITFIRDARDLSKIRLERRTPEKPIELTKRVENFVIGKIERFL